MISDNNEKELREVIQVQERKGAQRSDLEDPREEVTLKGRARAPSSETGRSGSGSFYAGLAG